MNSLWGRCDRVLCQWWLPLGLWALLSGYFWAPTTHNHKVIVNCLLALPCLLSLFYLPLWRDWLPRTPLLWLTLAYLVYMTAGSLIMTGHKGEEFIRWSAYIMLFLIGVGLRMRLTLSALTQLLLLSALAAALAGMYAIYRDIDAGIFLTYQYRLEGYGALYNALRSGMLFGAFAAISLWCAYSKNIAAWQRYVAIAVALSCLTALVFTGSRAPVLALLIIGIVITITYRRWQLLALVVVGSTLVLLLAWDKLFDRGTSFRLQIWPLVWAHYLDAPFFGVGLQRAPLKVIMDPFPTYNEHNLFLAILRQGGIVGFLLYLSVAITVCVQGWRARAQCSIAGLAAILQFYGLVSLQVDGVRLITRPSDSWVVLWLPIALLIYSQRSRREQAIASQ